MERAGTLAFVLLSSLLAAPALAQSSSVSIGTANVEGLVVGQRFSLDAAFSQEHDKEIPAPFEFVAPTSGDHRNYVAPATGFGIIKAFFLTPDERIMSNIQFMPYVVDQGELEERLDWSRPVLKQIFEMHVPEGAQSVVDGVRATEVGPYPAIEAIGRFDSGDDGTLVIRVVAIPNPSSEHGMAAVILANVNVLEISEVSEVYNTIASKALSTFRYQ